MEIPRTEENFGNAAISFSILLALTGIYSGYKLGGECTGNISRSEG